VIVNAMLELVAKGNLEPSADQNAEIAKVGRPVGVPAFQPIWHAYRRDEHSLPRGWDRCAAAVLAATGAGRCSNRRSPRVGFDEMKPFCLPGQVIASLGVLEDGDAQFVGIC